MMQAVFWMAIGSIVVATITIGTRMFLRFMEDVGWDLLSHYTRWLVDRGMSPLAGQLWRDSNFNIYRIESRNDNIIEFTGPTPYMSRVSVWEWHSIVNNRRLSLVR